MSVVFYKISKTQFLGSQTMSQIRTLPNIYIQYVVTLIITPVHSFVVIVFKWNWLLNVELKLIMFLHFRKVLWWPFPSYPVAMGRVTCWKRNTNLKAMNLQWIVNLTGYLKVCIYVNSDAGALKPLLLS